MKWKIKNVFPCVALLVFALLMYQFFEGSVENMVDIPQSQNIGTGTGVAYMKNSTCKNQNLRKIMKEVFTKHRIHKATTNEQPLLYIPCGYSKIKKEMQQCHSQFTPRENARIHLLPNTNELTSKDLIWKNLTKAYGRHRAKQLMPMTYVLKDSNDFDLFQREHDPQKIYIIKKNIQRQKGLLITNSKKEIVQGREKGFVIVQELLQNPYLIDGRKINLRFYVLVVSDGKGGLDAYVHRNGFMYYTAKRFQQNSLDSAPNITTGYIDRKVYDKNPLTLLDFRNFLGKRIATKTFDNIHRLLSTIIRAVPQLADSKSDSISFQLFGADIALDRNLRPLLMEINKGPDLGAKDKRDHQVKFNVVEDMMKVIKVVPNWQNHNFIPIVQ